MNQKIANNYLMYAGWFKDDNLSHHDASMEE
jgi:hypothetical protein